MSTTYDVDYFIRKFEAIPARHWRTGVVRDEIGRCCALGHCGCSGECTPDKKDFELTEEAKALVSLFGGTNSRAVYRINDSTEHLDENGNKDPRANILAALRSLKEATP